MSCKKCGQVHERCSAHVKRSDPLRPCMAHPKGEAPNCKSHGGGARQVVAKAERVAVEKAARKELDSLGLRREGLTAAALLQETIERVGADLDHLAREAAAGNEQAAAVYGEWQDRAVRVAKAGLDAGIAERQTAVVEGQADVIVGIVLAALAKVALTPDDRQLVVGELVAGFRALEAG